MVTATLFVIFDELDLVDAFLENEFDLLGYACTPSALIVSHYVPQFAKNGVAGETHFLGLVTLVGLFRLLSSLFNLLHLVGLCLLDLGVNLGFHQLIRTLGW